MTGLYVNTNVSALGAQINLQRSMGELTTTLTRLSTGLRINSGKDDPAGLIASELLKSDITATNMAIRNTQRANSVIGIADSALGQVSTLLNDIRGLVNEAANTGAMSSEQIEANQLQVNASLDSIDRIARTTNYQGTLLLDGSMDFITEGVNRKAVDNLQIHQANLGPNEHLDVTIDIKQQAEAGKLFFNKSGVSERTVFEVAGNKGTQVFTFEPDTKVTQMAEAINSYSDATGVMAIVGKDATHGQLMATSAGKDNDINFTAVLAGAAGGAYSIKYSAGTTNETTYKITEPTFNEKGEVVQAGTIEFFLKMEDAGYSEVKALDETYNGIHTVGLGGLAADNMVVQSDNDYNIRTFEVIRTDGAAAPSVDFDPVTGHLKILADDTHTNAQIAAAINAIDGFQVVQTGTGTLADPVVGHTATTDARPNNTLDIKTKIAGEKYENTDVIFVQRPAGGPATDPSFEYTDVAKSAKVTVSNNATFANGTQFLQFEAKTAGEDYNDVAIVFEPDTTNFGPGEVSAVYDENTKLLHIRGQISGANAASLGTLKGVIEANSPFRIDITSDAAGTTPIDLSTTMSFAAQTMTGDVTNIKTGQSAADMGTDHQSLIITIDPGTNVSDIITAFNASTNAELNTKFSMSSSPDSDGSGTIFWNANPPAEYSDPNIRIYNGALKGATSGTKTAVTANDLINFVNNDPKLSEIIHADLALNNSGTGLLTLFDEYAYYGDPNAETGLQFLGPKGTADIIFSCDNIPDQELEVYFSPDVLGYPSISVPAKNANAAVSIEATTKGGDYDDMVVRYVRRDNNHTDGYVKYTEGPSNAMAYCSINDTGTGTDEEVGKFIVYSNTQGELHNNVNIVAKLDVNQTEAAKAYFDAETNQFIISVNSTGVTLSAAMAAIEADGTFTADYDFSYNHDAGQTGPANSTFAQVFGGVGGGITSAVIGNTGTTGGHTGGVLEIALAGDDGDATLSANEVVQLLNDDPITQNLFKATNYPGSDGTGLISFRDDNLTTVTGGCGQTFLAPSAVSTGGIVQKGMMVVQLATDKYGNSITTARDLVDYFNTLTPEETRGVSVSLVRPVGQDNLLRTWTTDPCGNVTMTQECDDDFGRGILEPTCYKDPCDVTIYTPIEFTSFGSDIQSARAQDDIVSVNGWNSQFRIIAKDAGPHTEGTSIVYRKITNSDEQVRAEYDDLEKQIVVFIKDNTTAADVKSAIETSEQTKKLFSVELKTTGSALVVETDDDLNLQHGTYEAGYRGGAHMLGGYDADPHKLTFVSTDVGANQWVGVRTIEGGFEVTNEAGVVSTRDSGQDMVATTNGNKMTGNGRTLSVYSSTLQMTITLSDQLQVGDQVNFAITGGGATFQLGPDVVSSQQIRIALPNVSTATLGGLSGRLYQLRSDGDAALALDPGLADRIVQEAISAVTTIRGRLGALQRCTLEPNIASLQDSLEAITAAEADISNADFAQESSNLARSQILVQSGSNALGIANQMPQYAASLLG